MPMSRKAENSGRNFTVPMGLILGLLAAYVVLIDWRAISTAVAAIL